MLTCVEMGEKLMDEQLHLAERKRQHGASLITSLILLVAIMLLGVTTASITVQGEKAARNERDFSMAFFAAEAALRDAQQDIDSEEGRDTVVFLPPDPDAFLHGCGSRLQGKFHGLCLPAATDHPPLWLTTDLLNTGTANARTVAYGTYTGRSFPVGEGPLPAMSPRYLIELLSALPEAPPSGSEAVHAVYRITAVGFGMRASTHVVLQAVYRRDRVPNELKKSEEDLPYRFQSRRLSWREIPHWQELHDAIKKK